VESNNAENITQQENTADTYLDDLGVNWETLKGKKVLDLGAGLARFTQAAKRRGVNVISIDRHPEWHSDEGTPPKDVPYAIADGLYLPFLDNSFDVILSRAAVHSMIEIQEDMEQLINEAKRVLREGGEFRFGPGAVGVRPIRENEWDKWFELVDKVRNKKEITPEEDAWGEKVYPRIEQEEKEEEELKHLPPEQRARRAQRLFLVQLQSIDPLISMHEGNKNRDYYGDVYFVLKKPPAITNRNNSSKPVMG